jgi:hypothetical protein
VAGLPLVLALYYQQGLGHTALESGLAVTSYAVGSAVAAFARGQGGSPVSLVLWWCSTLRCPRSVLAHRFDTPEGAMLRLRNLRDEPVRIHVGKLKGQPFEVFSDDP